MSPGEGMASAIQNIRDKRSGVKDEDPEKKRARWRADKANQRARSRGETQTATETPREPYVADPTSIMLSGILGATLFNLAARIGHHRSLTDDETKALGTALDPVLWKWLPVLGDWKAETGLLVTCLALWQVTTPKPEEDESGADTGEGQALTSTYRGDGLSQSGG